jgi:hypothetical protein
VTNVVGVGAEPREPQRTRGDERDGRAGRRDARRVACASERRLVERRRAAQQAAGVQLDLHLAVGKHEGRERVPGFVKPHEDRRPGNEERDIHHPVRHYSAIGSTATGLYL